MTDRVALRGLVVECVVGVHAWERKKPRELVLDVVLELDLSNASVTDDLAATVDYDALAQSIRARVAGMSPKLIETVAGAVLDVCLADALVVAADVTVHKPGAVEGVEDVAVTLRRERRPAAPRRAPRRTRRAR